MLGKTSLRPRVKRNERADREPEGGVCLLTLLGVTPEMYFTLHGRVMMVSVLLQSGAQDGHGVFVPLLGGKTPPSQVSRPVVMSMYSAVLVKTSLAERL